MQDFGDISDPSLFRDVKLPFDVCNSADQERRSQVSLLQAVFETIKTLSASHTNHLSIYLTLQ